MFFDNMKGSSQTGNADCALGGNAPVIVNRALGSLHVTGTAHPTSHYVEAFRLARAMVGLSTATFVGSPPDDDAMLARVPRDYAGFLQTINGCVVFGGGLHIRGASRSPDWHSLRRAWIGQRCLSQLYPSVDVDDVPFAQDYLGDQFLLRSQSVLKLDGETGEIEDLEVGWREFLLAVATDPEDVLGLQFLERFTNESGPLLPGQLLSVYPPLCSVESSSGVSLKAVPANEHMYFLADFAAQIREVADGSKIRIVVR